MKQSFDLHSTIQICILAPKGRPTQETAFLEGLKTSLSFSGQAIYPAASFCQAMIVSAPNNSLGLEIKRCQITHSAEIIRHGSCMLRF